jgi:negative regulator of flagellin synthesis FlgM
VANTINGYQGNSATSVTTSRPQQSQRDNTAATPTGNSESGSNAAEVQITSTASQLASLGQTLSAMPAIDVGRVAKISQSLADGTYSISADKIASGLMQSDHALAQIGMQES